MTITKIKLDSPADYPTFELESDQVWTNFYLEADAAVTEYGTRFAYPEKQVGDIVVVKFGFRALRGMTDNGQPGWDRFTGDSIPANDLDQWIATAKIAPCGPNFKVDYTTIRLLRVDKRTIVQVKSETIELTAIGDQSIFESSFNRRFG